MLLKNFFSPIKSFDNHFDCSFHFEDSRSFFVANRKFIVRHDGEGSTPKNLDRDSLQGSVMGPALLSTNCKDQSRTQWDQATITRFADNSHLIRYN